MRRVEPRKQPTQERARATVERILAAGTRVLVDEGYERASTNRIAAAAGVSPGSLYQYFPNKDAIVVAAVGRYGEQLTADLADRLTALLDQPPRPMLRAMLDALVSALSEQPEILRVVVEQVPSAASRPLIDAFEQRVRDIARGYLMLHRAQMRDVDLESATWVLVRTAEALTVRYVLDRPPIEQAAFVEEAATLLERYFAPSSTFGSPAA